MTADERWLPVVGFPLYEVSDLGRVRSWMDGASSPYVLRTQKGYGGYPSVKLRDPSSDVGSRSLVVHKLVMYAFVGPPPVKGMMCCHENDIKDDNRLVNLRWDTVQGNADDRVRNQRLRSTGLMTLPPEMPK